MPAGFHPPHKAGLPNGYFTVTVYFHTTSLITRVDFPDRGTIGIGW
jgi:hypothetical protein